MENQIAPQTIAPQTEDTTQALLEGLIAQCRAIIQNDILPAARAGEYKDWQSHISDITDVMKTAVKLADAVGRLRRPEPPPPELRQRITVEKIQSLPKPQRGP